MGVSLLNIPCIHWTSASKTLKIKTENHGNIIPNKHVFVVMTVMSGHYLDYVINNTIIYRSIFVWPRKYVEVWHSYELVHVSNYTCWRMWSQCHNDNKMVEKIQPSVINDGNYSSFKRWGKLSNHLLVSKLAQNMLR